MKQHFQTLHMEQHRQSSLRGEAPLTAWRELLPRQQPRERAQAEPRLPQLKRQTWGSGDAREARAYRAGYREVRATKKTPSRDLKSSSEY